MGVHYHVFMGVAQAAPMASITINDYDESIRKFLTLAKGVYGDQEFFRDGLNYQNLLIMSNFGEGAPMTLGIPGLCVQWFPCRQPKCMSPSWN